MKQPYWKPQHEVFIRCMLRHGDATRAYHTTYPKASNASARVGGIRLNNYPHIGQRIQPILRQRHEEVNRLAMKEGLARTKAQVLRRHYIRGVLCAMAMGEMKKNRHFMVNGQQLTMQEGISHAALLHVVSLDLKLADGYNNWNSIELQFEKLTHNTAPTQAVISNRAEQSDAQQETSREYAIGFIGKPQEISPGGRNDAAIFRQQTVTNSRESLIPATVTTISTNPENHPKTDNKTINDNKFSDAACYFDTLKPATACIRKRL